MLHRFRQFEASKLCVNDVFERGLLAKGVGVCHGCSGSGLALLSHFRVADDRASLTKACQFAQCIIDDRRFVDATMATGDEPLSLFNGLAGRIWFLTELREALGGPKSPIPVRWKKAFGFA